MLLSDIRQEFINRGARRLTCPCCNAGCLIKPNNELEEGQFMVHEDRCTFLSACRNMGIKHYDFNDERVMRILVIKDLVNP